MASRMNAERDDTIVVVGPCASGKSTLVRGLRFHGFDARVCAQEHSGVPSLWRRRGRPTLIALTVELEATRLRREGRWPRAIHAAQLTRLGDAYANADLIIRTDDLTSSGVLSAALQFLDQSTSAVQGPSSMLEGS